MEHCRLFIAGQFVDAQDGQTFETIDPGTGHPFATVARAGADAVTSLTKEIGHPLAVGVEPESFMELAMHAAADPAVMFNPRPTQGPAGVFEVFTAAA